MDAGIFVFGSTFNGFGAEGCDIDMCLFPQGPSMSDKQLLSQVCIHMYSERCSLRPPGERPASETLWPFHQGED